MNATAYLQQLPKDIQFDLFLSAACYLKHSRPGDACLDLINKDKSRLTDNSFVLQSRWKQTAERIPLSRLARLLPKAAKDYIAVVEARLKTSDFPGEPSHKSLVQSFLESKGIILHSQKDNPDNDTGLQRVLKMGAFAMAGPLAIGMGEGLMGQARNAANAEFSQWQMWAVSQPDWEEWVKNAEADHNARRAQWERGETARLEWKESTVYRVLLSISQM